MNRVDFMDQLERLLQSIAPAERDEALQYYNDYFDDAGRENEQEVIEALGNPARVAENIKRDLMGSGYGGAPVPKAQASDRALVEYGKETSGEQALDGDRTEKNTSGTGGDSAGTADNRNPFGTSGEDIFSGNGGAAGGNGTGETVSPRQGDTGTQSGSNTYEGHPEKAGMPPWAVALLVTLLIFASPAVLGLACALFGIVICWYALILCAGVAAAALLMVMVALVITGILCIPADPWVGMAMLGGGLVCGGIGVLFLMLTVAMAGIVTPAVWRGIRFLFGRRGARRQKSYGGA